MTHAGDVDLAFLSDWPSAIKDGRVHLSADVAQTKFPSTEGPSNLNIAWILLGAMLLRYYCPRVCFRATPTNSFIGERACADGHINGWCLRTSRVRNSPEAQSHKISPD
jgi:hypothetical protein